MFYQWYVALLTPPTFYTGRPASDFAGALCYLLQVIWHYLRAITLSLHSTWGLWESWDSSTRRKTSKRTNKCSQSAMTFPAMKSRVLFSGEINHLPSMKEDPASTKVRHSDRTRRLLRLTFC